MPVLTIDYETAFSTEYSLTRMAEYEYILHPQFQCIMCAFKLDNGPTVVRVGHEAVAAEFAKYDWSKTALCSHNMRFDGAIAAWHFGVVPAMYLDTLSMARALVVAKTGRVSLKKVAEYLALPAKGGEIENMRGKRLADFTQEQLQRAIDYCANDNDLCREIFNRFMKAFPKKELRIVDMVMRMYIQPQVYLDPNVLTKHLAAVRAEKAAIMARVSHLDKSVFSSNHKFAELLKSHGVEPPTKTSPATGLETWALAKNDRAFKELCEDDEQPLEVQAVLAARVNSKSTIEETRTEKLLKLSLREWAPAPVPGLDTLAWFGANGHGMLPRRKGLAPVPLKFSGAHTHRFSGDGGFNFQNFKRGSRIKEALVAPPGMRIVHRDASAIEARMLAFLANCKRLLDIYENNGDVYCEFASKIYNRTITKADKMERVVGKVCILGLGYQTGADKLRHTLFIGNGGVSVKVDEDVARLYVYAYRNTYPEIPRLWASGERALASMMAMTQPFSFGDRLGRLDGPYVGQFPVIELGPDAIWMPNGFAIQYPELSTRMVTLPNGHRVSKTQYSDGRGGWNDIYGGKFTENADQGLSRVVVMDVANRIYHDLKIWPWLSTHDSLDYCVPENQARDFDARLAHEFSIRPTWAPRLPLASEGGWGVNLAIAEDDKHPEHNK